MSWFFGLTNALLPFSERMNRKAIGVGKLLLRQAKFLTHGSDINAFIRNLNACDAHTGRPSIHIVHGFLKPLDNLLTDISFTHSRSHNPLKWLSFFPPPNITHWVTKSIPLPVKFLDFYRMPFCETPKAWLQMKISLR